MAANTSVLLFITLWVSLQDGLGLPLGKQPEAEAADSVLTHTARTKRCACSNLLDSECHYFCHLDIIWVNTPSKTTLYGLGSAPSRRRRSTSRCSCANANDQTCNNFCNHSPQITSPKKSVKRRQLDILNILRAVFNRSRRALDALNSEKSQRKSIR